MQVDQLFQVPTSVAQVWRPLCEKSMHSTVDEDDDKATELGVIKITNEVGTDLNACAFA